MDTTQGNFQDRSETITEILEVLEYATHSAARRWFDEVIAEAAQAEKDSGPTETGLERISIDAARITRLGHAIQDIGDAAIRTLEAAIEKLQKEATAAQTEGVRKVVSSVLEGFETLIAETNRTREEIEKARAAAETNKRRCGRKVSEGCDNPNCGVCYPLAGVEGFQGEVEGGEAHHISDSPRAS